MGFVGYYWLILALPLAALLIELLVTRNLDLAAQGVFRRTRTTERGGHGAAVDPAHAPRTEAAEAGASDDATVAHSGPASATHDDAHGAHADAHAGGGHGEHGGPTPFWGRVTSGVGIVAMLGAFIVALGILIQFATDPTVARNGLTFHFYDWFSFGFLRYPIDFRVDALTAVMLVVVTGVSLLVHLYSTGYMAGDPGYPRFFIDLALFTLSMLILVLAANLLVIFIGWELVGLSSYLLIGFWYYHAPPPPGSEVPYPPPSQLKAFVTTRLGDYGFLIGILMLFLGTGTFDFSSLNSATASATGRIDNQVVITVAMILIFCGAVGKSAQFPLHVWLPDAMAGPTPVSALIHAATMVAAGVYLVARLFPVYHLYAGPQSLAVVGYIGAFTAFFAATIALVQNDIKGVLAYSTISQLGYMFTGLAAAGDIPNGTNAVGVNHLFTHAFFKALLFLGSGCVIHAVSVQDMRKMGGLAKFMPITAGCFLIANLAIAGIPPFSGFWSKDPIVSLAFDYGLRNGGAAYLLYIFTFATSFLTAFYMFRLYFMTFGGRGGSAIGFWGGARQYRGEEHPHEAPWTMTTPLVILAAVTIGIGIWGFFGYNDWLATLLNGGAAPHYEVTPALDIATLGTVGAGLLGILLAWAMYGVAVVPANALTANPVGGAIYVLFKRAYFVNELYGLLIKYLVLGLANLVVLFDRYIIDGIVNGLAAGVREIGDGTRRSETGLLQNYGAAIFGGALIIMLVLFFATGAIGR